MTYSHNSQANPHGYFPSQITELLGFDRENC
uniref:Uncharacterized protein n=1 Tax=Lepeophtheirus salmonis TaxID=72036 RepID=A0A0K2UW89_LEPSM